MRLPQGLTKHLFNTKNLWGEGKSFIKLWPHPLHTNEFIIFQNKLFPLVTRNFYVCTTIYRNFCEPEPARFAEKNKEIPYENVSRNHSKTLSFFFFAPGDIVKFKLNPNCLHKWHSWQCTLTESKFPTGILGSIPDEGMTCYFLMKASRFIFVRGITCYFLIAGPPPVGGGNFVSFIRKKLVLKNKEFSCVEGVSI